MLTSAYPSGWLVGKFGAQPVLCLMAFFPLLMCATSGLIREERQGARWSGEGEDVTGTMCRLHARCQCQHSLRASRKGEVGVLHSDYES